MARTPMKRNKSSQKLIKFKASKSTKKLSSPEFSYTNYSPKQSEQYSIDIQDEIKMEEPIAKIKKSPRKSSPKKSQKSQKSDRNRSLEIVGEEAETQEESNILSIRKTMNNSSINNLTLSDL